MEQEICFFKCETFNKMNKIVEYFKEHVELWLQTGIVSFKLNYATKCKKVLGIKEKLGKTGIC